MTEPATHPHHWLIAERVPSQRYSLGTCRTCGTERRFDNWSPEEQGRAWNDSGTLQGSFRAMQARRGR